MNSLKKNQIKFLKKGPRSMDSNKYETELYKLAIKTWGEQAQVNMAIEECAELILAIQKYFYGKNRELARPNLIEGLADIEIMCAQMKTILGPYGDSVNSWKKNKLERLNARLQEALSREKD